MNPNDSTEKGGKKKTEKKINFRTGCPAFPLLCIMIEVKKKKKKKEKFSVDIMIIFFHVDVNTYVHSKKFYLCVISSVSFFFSLFFIYVSFNYFFLFIVVSREKETVDIICPTRVVSN